MIERDLFPAIMSHINSPEAIVVTGMRRVGKTTLLRAVMDSIPSSNSIFLDLENPANRKLFEETNYDRILDSLRFLGLDVQKRGYVFLDEIQFMKNLPSVVKYLSDHYPIKFFLTGSSSYYLKNLFTESLAGRKFIFELFPLSFREFLRFRNPSINLDLPDRLVPPAVFDMLDRHYDEYLRYGGFPGVVLKESTREKEMMLDDIFSSYFQLEITQLGDFRKTGVIRDLILLLMERCGSRLDIQKLSKELGVARETVGNYLAFLESTYFISLIRPFSRNRDTEIRSMPKFYLCDTGLIRRFARASDGALFENAVYCALRGRGKVNYYQKKSGVEIDFVLNEKSAYEVKITAEEKDLRRLKSLSSELGLTDYRVVALKLSRLENVTYGFML